MRYLVAGATALTLVVSPAFAGSAQAVKDCFDRKTQPYTSVVDSHLHLRPFGGPGIPLAEMGDYWRRTGVRYVNLYGIGQTVPDDSACTYYLDCPGTPVLPNVKNDLANARDVLETKIDGVHLTVSMTFPDLARPEGVVDEMRRLDAAYPGEFGWMGEVNLIKQALLNNDAEPATPLDIAGWWPFMDELRRRDAPITIHSDIGNDADPLQFLYLMETVLALYPANEIVWAHAGLSRELTTIDADLHIATLQRLLDQHPKLYLDISWRVLDDAYFSRDTVRDRYVPFLNRYSKRILPGTDFVASRNLGFAAYAQALDVTSHINRYLSDAAFRDIALGQSYFELLNLPDQAPPVCAG